jgi:hypothetical protein
MAREEGRKPNTYSNYSAEHRWLERAGLWDMHHAKEQADRVQKKYFASKDRYIQCLEKVLDLGWSKIEQMIDNNELPPPNVALRMVFESIRLIRDLKVESEIAKELHKDLTDNAEIDFSKFSSEETEEFIRLLEKSKARLVGFPDDPATKN